MTDTDMKRLEYSAAFRHAYDTLKTYYGRADDVALEAIDAANAAFLDKHESIRLFVAHLNCVVLNELARKA